MFFLALDFFLRALVSPQLSLLDVMARILFVPPADLNGRALSGLNLIESL